MSILGIAAIVPVGLQESPFLSDAGHLIGRDPRGLRAAEWAVWPGPRLVGLKAIRGKCLDCAHNLADVRKCTVISCPLWPLRMGIVPKGYRPAAGEAERESHDEPDFTAREGGDTAGKVAA